MKLSPEAIKEFQAITREEYGIELSGAEAGIEAMRILLFYEMIYRPLPSELQSKQPSTDSPAPNHEQGAG